MIPIARVHLYCALMRIAGSISMHMCESHIPVRNYKQDQ
eukprot:SAG31_NODE_42857_length_269_cov_1.517647_1_plen_38_part_10